MPYVKWVGYDKQDTLKIGYIACADVYQVSHLVALQGITLINHAVISAGRRVTFNEKKEIIYELSQLLHAHIRLSQSLAIIASLIKKEYPRQVILFCLRSVNQGKSLAYAAEKFPDLFDILTVHALRAGHDSGLLAQACAERSAQLAEIAQLRAKVRTACSIPLISGTFFIAVIIFILTVILPQFKNIFQVLKTPLPASTRMLIALSEQRIAVAVAAGALIVSLLIMCVALLKTSPGIKVYDMLLVRTPLVSSIYKDLARAQVLQSLALLITSGRSFALALANVAESFTHQGIKKQLMALHAALQQGTPSIQALQACPLLATPEIINSLTLSQESVQMAAIMKQLSALFRGRALKMLDRMILFVQPLLLMLLGGAIGAIMVALYLPLLQIPHLF